jgi:hypothetical protein
MIVAELYANKQWHSIEIELAFQMGPSRLMRCPDCHGRVRAHKAGTTGQRAHMEHYERHCGCSRSAAFGGERPPHPSALT